MNCKCAGQPFTKYNQIASFVQYNILIPPVILSLTLELSASFNEDTIPIHNLLASTKALSLHFQVVNHSNYKSDIITKRP